MISRSSPTHLTLISLTSPAHPSSSLSYPLQLPPITIPLQPLSSLLLQWSTLFQHRLYFPFSILLTPSPPLPSSHITLLLLIVTSLLLYLINSLHTPVLVLPSLSLLPLSTSIYCFLFLLSFLHCQLFFLSLPFSINYSPFLFLTHLFSVFSSLSPSSSVYSSAFLPFSSLFWLLFSLPISSLTHSLFSLPTSPSPFPLTLLSSFLTLPY